MSLRPPVDPADIRSHVLRDGDVAVRVLSLGCVVQSWVVDGTPVVLGYVDLADYIANPYCMGMVAGRVANRVRNARFNLGRVEYTLPANDPPHHLHGGPGGIGWRNWTLEPDGPKAARLTLETPHLDQGWPGAARFKVILRLHNAQLTYDISATTDRPAPINLAQHSYFNLNGTGDILDHELQINAPHYTPNDATGVPTGAIDPVAGTRFDFTRPRRIGDANPDLGPDLSPDLGGFDGNLALQGGHAVHLTGAKRSLELWTDQPGLQLYTGGKLGHHGTPAPGPNHAPFAGLCLEAQGFPDAVNQPHFPQILCTPDAPYRHITRIEIT